MTDTCVVLAAIGQGAADQPSDRSARGDPSQGALRRARPRVHQGPLDQEEQGASGEAERDDPFGAEAGEGAPRREEHGNRGGDRDRAAGPHSGAGAPHRLRSRKARSDSSNRRESTFHSSA